jgi:hypothetical protein
VKRLSLFGELGKADGADAAVRAQLAASLAHIHDRAKGQLQLDEACFQAALGHIRAHRQDPGIFARYYDVVFAIGANQLEKANSLLNEIVERASAPVHFEIIPFSEEQLGEDFERFPRLIFAEFSSVSPMVSPSRAQARASVQAMQEALDIVAEIDPAIRSEIDQLLARVVLAAPNPDSSARAFGGVTSFLVWGASFANIEHYKTCWHLVQFFVHEITHALLFGLSLNEPLVKNAPEESYRSPLRADARPMDGIYHATLVCGRLADFNKTWLNSGTLAKADREACEKAVANNLARFRDGLDVIEECGQLSDRARKLISRARESLL